MALFWETVVTHKMWIATIGLGFCRLVSHAIRVLPATLAKQLEEADHLTQFEYSTLNSIYVLPSCVTPLFCGMLVDRYGAGKCMVVFMFFIAVGQLGFSFGVHYGFALSITGRFLGGCTWMALDSVKIPLIKELFGSTAQALPMTVTDVGARLGILISFLAIAEIYDGFGLSAVFVITSALGFLGVFVSFVVYQLMAGKKKYKILNSQELVSRKVKRYSVSVPSDTEEKTNESSEIEVQLSRLLPDEPKSSVATHDVGVPLVALSSPQNENCGPNSIDYDCAEEEFVNVPLKPNKNDTNKVLKEKVEVSAFGAEFWVLNLMVALCYAGCPTFILFASQYFQEVYSDSFEQANLDSSMIENFVIIMGPLGGLLIDRYGGRSVMLLIGNIIINIGNVLVILAAGLHLPAFIVACILGFGWSAVYVSAWSLVPTTVRNPKSLGLGAGITGCSQNIGLFIGTTVVGLIEEWDHSVRKTAMIQYFLSVSLTVLVVNLYFIFVVETTRN